MASEFEMQVVIRDTGQVVVAWAPGRDAEQDFIKDIRRRVEAKSVGVFRTTDTVGLAVETAVREFLRALKERV